MKEERLVDLIWNNTPNAMEWRSAVAAAAAVLFAACGGGSDEAVPRTASPPVVVVSTPAVGVGGSGDYEAPIRDTFAVVDPGGRYGWFESGRPQGLENHYGLDLAAPAGTPIYAPRGGKIIRASWHADFGNVMLIETTPVAGRGIVVILLAHMSGFAAGLRVGDVVEKGQLVGYVGNTGLVMDEGQGGHHLHIAVIDSATRLPWASSGSLGVAQDYLTWKDPAAYIAALAAYAGPGPKKDVANDAPVLVLNGATSGSVTVGSMMVVQATVVDQQGGLLRLWMSDGFEETKAYTPGAAFSFQRVMNQPGTAIGWSVQAVDELGAVSNKIEGTLTVASLTPVPAPVVTDNKPTLRLESQCSTINVGEVCEIRLVADDDTGLDRVQISWDGKADEAAASGLSKRVTFRRSFDNAGQIEWTARAYDKAGQRSSILSGSFTVGKPSAPAPAFSITGFVQKAWSASAEVETLTIIAPGVVTGTTVTLISPSLEEFKNCCKKGKATVSGDRVEVKPRFEEAGWWGVVVILPDGRADTEVFYVGP